MTTEEPSYMAFARAAVRNKEPLSHVAVGGLVDRIDRGASALKAAQPRTISTVEELDALPDRSYIMDAEPDIMAKDDGKWRSPNYPGDAFPATAVALPATVLYEPQP